MTVNDDKNKWKNKWKNKCMRCIKKPFGWQSMMIKINERINERINVWDDDINKWKNKWLKNIRKE